VARCEGASGAGSACDSSHGRVQLVPDAVTVRTVEAETPLV